MLAMLIMLSTAACGVAGNDTATSAQSNGCQVDVIRRCDEMRNTFNNPLARLMQGQNPPTTRELVIPIMMPNGGPNIDIRCGINTKDSTIAYARVVQPPNLTTDDLLSLRARGYRS